MNQRGIITVRMSPGLVEQLRRQAHAEHKSLNQLCVERLVGGDSAAAAELLAHERARLLREITGLLAPAAEEPVSQAKAWISDLEKEKAVCA